MTALALSKDEIFLEEWLNLSFLPDTEIADEKNGGTGAGGAAVGRTISANERAINAVSESAGATGTLEVSNLGQIRSVKMPEKWIAGAAQTGIAGSGTFCEYHPHESPDTNICFFYRGRPVKAAAAENFSKLLCEKPHFLSASELKGIAEIIRDKSDSEVFSTLIAKTAYWNGKCVLIVEGRYKNYNEDTFAIFVDASGIGWFVQEIYFQSPRADYVKYRKEAKASLATIMWK